MKKWFVAVIAAVGLAACSNNEEADLAEKASVIEEGTVGFEIAGGTIEEATGVPDNEKKNLLNAFEEYIEAFNSKDIDRYVATLSKDPKGFDLEADKKEVMKAFETYEIERVAEDMTIVKYEGEEAHVYANLTISTVELATDTELSSQGRQVTVFMKEDGAWKVSSVYYIGNN